MKKSLILTIALSISLSINAQNKKHMTFQAEIANRSGDQLTFLNDKNKAVKTIAINKEGVFKDTMNVPTGRYLLAQGEKYTIIYLKNGFDLKMKTDAKQFEESIVYTGKGEAENNFLVKNYLAQKQIDGKSLLAADEAGFLKGLDQIKADDLKRLNEKKLDPEFVSLQKQGNEDNYNAITKYYKQNYETNLAKNKLNNTIAPPFNYENYKGGQTKLEDFKGKYVYIDVWATWCGPCRAEIPALQATEEKYKDKNIEFVSISIDLDKDHEKWKALVKEKQLGGVQLFADKNWTSDFMTSFGVTSIPRFILIDPNGKVVKSDAERPSDPELQKTLDSLLN